MKAKRNIKRILKWIFITTLIISFVLGVCLTWVFSILPPDFDKMEKYYRRDKDDLTLVYDYMCNLDYSYVHIDKEYIEKRSMFTGEYYPGYEEIKDEAVLKAMERLLGYKGYGYISKSSNTVVFNKWCWGERELGIAVRIDKDAPPLAPQYLIKTVPISNQGWYYYESDYEEHRSGR